MKQANIIKPRNPDEWRILKAAAETFLEKGFTATTMTDLVASTGLNRATLYSGYGSKHQIYIQAMEHLQFDSRPRWEAVLSLEPGPAHSLASILSALLDLAPKMSDGEFFTRAAVELGDDPATARRIASYWDHMKADLTELFKRAQNSGQLPENRRPEAAAALIVTLVQGRYVAGAIDPEHRDEDQAQLGKALADLLLEAVTPVAGRGAGRRRASCHKPPEAPVPGREDGPAQSAGESPGRGHLRRRPASASLSPTAATRS
ncbi:TetR/AcrR family transcriptional regulator [Salininema proteolyticum]|uniref:TetR/AcrR family transcriptional regulator n=1 Tax=Salininema proteolyticum TaxID=1607685 RepID=A0ABV8TT87_9ACTN